MNRSTERTLNPLDQMTEQNTNSFAGSYTTIMIPHGTILFRFCRNVQYKYSDCWTDKETIKEIFQAYHERQEKYPHANRTSQINAQVYNRLGIAKSWSNLEYLLTIEVKKEMVAHVGAIKEQSFFQDVDNESELRKLKVVAGGRQYIIPRIKNYAYKNELQVLHTYVRDIELVKFKESSWCKRFVKAGYFLH